MANLVLILEVLRKIVYGFAAPLLVIACVIAVVVGVFWALEVVDTMSEDAHREPWAHKTLVDTAGRRGTHDA